MGIEIDADVQAVCKYMQATFSREKLEQIAAGVALLAPLLWGSGNNRPLCLPQEQRTAINESSGT
jgi:hypothetical protein